MIEHISTSAISAIKNANVSSSEKTTAEITRSFGEYLNDALSNVAAQEANVHKMNDLYLAGQVDATEVLVAASQSQISLQFTSEIRNKVVAAYQEIMRIQV
ncbi:flagellar hook-basal body complex protein FliE [Paenibacillus montaniterrae]|uniref:Flagellar hook-basal body complex protein FliE n=1 Tax=Paenibacillus montaniterrae TaxID=429341 RepID=A0A920CWS2_9BACL|nr:flagellar hook-basal body complex protein FliE [Paenibacillus montaniterrae]GIP14543.1 flagellar hook-basal body complex protein FliE [Paenibacillus montaniterrae]